MHHKTHKCNQFCALLNNIQPTQLITWLILTRLNITTTNNNTET